jgi:aryl-alcohol dehydrogenase-like predicted oxidoreductase
MELRNLGKSGLRVSLIGLGCNNFGWRIGLEESRKVVHRALDLGVTLLDTADIYGEKGGSETALGEILGPKRKDIVLATKFGMPMGDSDWLKGGSRRRMMAAVEESLRRLKTDWIDLYQLHQPDPLTPIEETLRAFDDLIRQGKVRYVGCSNLPGWQVADAQWTAKAEGLNAFVSCQDEYSLVVRGIEKELLPAARRFGLGLLPFFPLASGLLTGKYRGGGAKDARLAEIQRLADRYMSERNLAVAAKLEDWAKTRGHSLLELAFSWLAAEPLTASVIAGATRPEQVEQNVRAAGWKLTAAELEEVDRITQG